MLITEFKTQMLVDLLQFTVVIVPLVSLWWRNVLYHVAGVVWGLVVALQATAGGSWSVDKKVNPHPSLGARAVAMTGRWAFHVRGLLQVFTSLAKLLVFSSIGTVVTYVELVQHVSAAFLYLFSTQVENPDPKWQHRLRQNVVFWQRLRNVVATVYFTVLWFGLFTRCNGDWSCSWSALGGMSSDSLSQAFTFTFMDSPAGSRCFWAALGAAVEFASLASGLPSGPTRGNLIFLYSAINIEVTTGAFLRP